MRRSLSARILAFVLWFVCGVIAVGSGVGGAVMLDQGIFHTTQEEYEYELFEEKIGGDTYGPVLHVVVEQADVTTLDERLGSTNVGVKLEYTDSKFVNQSYETENINNNSPYQYEQEYTLRDFYLKYPHEDSYSSEEYEAQYPEVNWDSTLKITTTIDDNFTEVDEYYWANFILNIAFALRGVIWIIMVFSAILSIACFIFLLWSAGYHKGSEEPVARGTARIPCDVFYIGYPIITASITAIISNMFYGELIVLMFGYLIITAMILLMDIFARTRTKHWWKYSLINRIFRRIFIQLKHTPLILFGVVAYLGLSFLFFLMTMAIGFFGVFLWGMLNLGLFAFTMYSFVMVKKLHTSSSLLALGDFEHKADTQGMIGEYHGVAMNLNAIAEGMDKAVEEKMKSERFKTELISNVSHDIKTPLTSIINYADLLNKEVERAELNREKLQEYGSVLLNNSNRLKKLTEDLIEASKASTGNVELQLEKCDLGVLLQQAVGEYDEKLKKAQLEMVLKNVEEPLLIMADNRHIWRVFDNLMNNICKYAQPGTRVYLSTAKKDSKIEVAFRNTSKYALDMDGDTLVERFVRGDNSRHSEGSGLGLSIAKNLVELQGGTFELYVDGDLFKIVLVFVEKT